MLESGDKLEKRCLSFSQNMKAIIPLPFGARWSRGSPTIWTLSCWRLTRPESLILNRIGHGLACHPNAQLPGACQSAVGDSQTSTNDACYKWRCSHGHATNYPRASPSKWQKLYWNAHPACKTSHTNQNDSWRDQTCGGRIANTGMKLMKWYSFIDFPCFHMFSWLKKNRMNSPLMVAETYRTLVPFPRPSAINLSTYQFYSHFGVVKTHMGVSENKVYPTSSHSFRGELMIKWWIWGCSPFGMSKTHTSYCIKLVTYTYNYIYAYIPL